MTVEGFTVENAQFEGILVVNAYQVTIRNNHILSNDRALNTSGQESTCPGQPSFETNEGFDCGGGLHIMGVRNSTITKPMAFSSTTIPVHLQ